MDERGVERRQIVLLGLIGEGRVDRIDIRPHF